MKTATWVVAVVLLAAGAVGAADQTGLDQLKTGVSCPAVQPGTSSVCPVDKKAGGCCATSQPAGDCCATSKPAGECCKSSGKCSAASKPACCGSCPTTQPTTAAAALPVGDPNVPESWFLRAEAEIDALPDVEAKDEVAKLMGIARADAGDYQGAAAAAKKLEDPMRSEIFSSIILGHARAGDVSAIKAVADQITESRIHDNGLWRAVSVLCGKGRLASAEEVAALVTDPGLRSRVYVLIAKKYAMAENMDKAKAIAEQIPEKRLKDYMPEAMAKIGTVISNDSAKDGADEQPETDKVQEILTGLAAAFAHRGNLEDALRFAGRQEAFVQQALAYVAVAEAMADRGEQAGVDRAFSLAEQSAGKDSDSLAKGISYAAVAMAKLKIGDLAGARKSMQDVLAIPEGSEEPFRLEVGSFSASGKPALLGLRLRLGDVQEALAMAKTPNGDYGWMDCYLIGMMLAKEGRMEPLGQWMSTLASAPERVYANIGVGAGLLARKQSPPKGP
jgi:hypothetical protein